MERLQQLRRDCSDLVQQTFGLDDIHDIVLDQISSRVEIDLEMYENSLRRLTKPSACPSLALPSINLIYSSASSNPEGDTESIGCQTGGSMYH
ncbi:hypothetical protein DSO57_1007399 [Entomophthora muscae]|uniref:Uncharacterized protein n=1 Tax=Entomophthora muscae TaxID=34485 RepID=A0ACC2TUR8_9FUNG|nr:hypothetical protein DSO57_1007399 [Entomophthora muscae]